MTLFSASRGAHQGGGGEHLYFRLDIILVKGLSKRTLNTYFSDVKIDPKYVFFAYVFVNLCHVLSKFVNMTENIPCFPNVHIFEPLNDVCVYIAWSWKTTLITWIFFTRIISNFKYKSPPPPPPPRCPSPFYSGRPDYYCYERVLVHCTTNLFTSPPRLVPYSFSSPGWRGAMRVKCLAQEHVTSQS